MRYKFTFAEGPVRVLRIFVLVCRSGWSVEDRALDHV